MIPLTKREEENHNKQKVCYICKRELNIDDRKHYKVKDHCMIREIIEVQLITSVI